jgi:hypothetical protein
MNRMSDTDRARYGGWLLSKLMQTPAGGLDAYREEHLEGRSIAREDLAALRACLLELHEALEANAPHAWRRVHRAAAALGAIAISGEETLRVREDPTSAALPFQHTAVAVAPPPRAPLEPHAAMGLTAGLSPGAGRSSSEPVLPFDGRTGPDAVVLVGKQSLTLEHHAELTAARARWDGWAEERAAYGIHDDAAFEAFDRAWRERFAREPDLQRRWAVACQRAYKTRGGSP